MMEDDRMSQIVSEIGSAISRRGFLCTTRADEGTTYGTLIVEIELPLFGRRYEATITGAAVNGMHPEHADRFVNEIADGICAEALAGFRN